MANELVPAVGYRVDVVCKDGHQLSLSIPDATELRIVSAQHFARWESRSNMTIKSSESEQVREVRLWNDRSSE